MLYVDYRLVAAQSVVLSGCSRSGLKLMTFDSGSPSRRTTVAAGRVEFNGDLELGYLEPNLINIED